MWFEFYLKFPVGDFMFNKTDFKYKLTQKIEVSNIQKIKFKLILNNVIFVLNNSSHIKKKTSCSSPDERLETEKYRRLDGS